MGAEPGPVAIPGMPGLQAHLRVDPRGRRLTAQRADAGPAGVRWLQFRVSGAGPGDRGAGRVEQCPQRRAVAVQRGPAAIGKCDRGAGRDTAAVLVCRDVSGIFQLAQVRDQVARGQPDQVLQPGEGPVVTLAQAGQRHHDAQPRRDVDRRVQVVVAHARCSLGSMAAMSRTPPPPARAQTARTVTGPAHEAPAATASSQMPRVSRGQLSPMVLAEVATNTKPATSMGAVTPSTTCIGRLTPAPTSAIFSMSSAAYPAPRARTKMPRCTSDRPPTPLAARSTTCAVMIAAIASSNSASSSVGHAGPWNGCCPRTDSHIAP